MGPENAERESCWRSHVSGEFNVSLEGTANSPLPSPPSLVGFLVGFLCGACQHVPLPVGSVCCGGGAAFCVLHWLLLYEVKGKSVHDTIPAVEVPEVKVSVFQSLTHVQVHR